MGMHEYDPAEVDRQFDYALANIASSSGKTRTIASIFYAAKQNGYVPQQELKASVGGAVPPFDLLKGIPAHLPDGMEPNTFIGPRLGRAQLFPAKAISLLVALGSVGKTATLISMSCHMGTGHPWGGDPLQARRGLFFSVEEPQQELERRFGATMDGLPERYMRFAQENLRLFSMRDRDPRLTVPVGSDVQPSGLGDRVIDAALEHQAEFIILDHLQGLASGDLNNSTTMVILAAECNRIAERTGAAVIVAAHTNKGNINAEKVSHGFTTGSLAIENAARQVVGLIPMPPDDAKRFGLEAVAREYIRIEMPKNSYGPPGEIGYLAKHYVPKFHTVSVVPYNPPAFVGGSVMPHGARLPNAISQYIRDNVWTTANKLDQLAGVKGKFKASRNQVRVALADLIAGGTIEEKAIDKGERERLGISQQVRKILTVKE
jgi:RecA-family ATPase